MTMQNDISDFFQTKTGQKLLHSVCRIADALEDIRNVVIKIDTIVESWRSEEEKELSQIIADVVKDKESARDRNLGD